MPLARRIATRDDCASIYTAGSGFVIDPFNRKIHTASCQRVPGIGLTDPKWFAPDERSALTYLQQRMDSYKTARPVTPCRHCGHGIPASLHRVERSSGAAPATPRTRSTGAAEFRFHVSAPREKRVDAWSEPQRLAYSDQTQAFRLALRTTLSALRADAGEVLHGVLESPVLLGDEWNPPDAENVLFYNLQSPGCFAGAAATGLRFERVFRTPMDPPPELPMALHHHIYEVTKMSVPFRHWRRGADLVCWEPVECGPFDDMTPTAPLWRVLRTAPLACEPTPAMEPPEHFGLSVKMVCSTANAVALIKKCVDCSVAAFHVHTDQATLKDVAGRLGRILYEDPDQIEQLLASNDRAVLGAPAHARGRLVRRHGDVGVAFCPDDDRCVAGDLLLDVDPSATSWSIAGKLFVVEPLGL